jgi:biopolymer transport protein ExbD
MSGFLNVNENDDDEAIAQINIIPFVDISLVLLVVFMLTANIIAKASIDVELPHAANAGETVGATLNIVATANGDLFLDGVSVPRSSLRAALAERIHREPQLRAVIAADKSVRYEIVVNIIDVLKEVGVTSFALNIERADR